jgi:CYTH domain-containing protein
MELDVFEVPPGLVVLEVELEDPSEVPELPPILLARLVREVSLEVAYLNHELARRPEPSG